MMDPTTNPKDAAGRAKLPMHLWPASATAAGCLGFREGELKYGRLNYRGTPVAASVYVAAAKRHIDAWMEGENNTRDYGTPHLGNALACLAILVDAQVNGTLVDDRNFAPQPGAYEDFVEEMTKISARLTEMLGSIQPKHWDRRDQVAGEQATQKSFAFDQEPKAKQDKVMTGMGTTAGTGIPTPSAEAACDCFICRLEALAKKDAKGLNAKGGVRFVSLGDLKRAGKF